MASKINVLPSSFPGLDLQPTACIRLERTETVDDLIDDIVDRLPASVQRKRLALATNDNKSLSGPLANYLSSGMDMEFLPLRLSATLVGGKDFPNNEGPRENEGKYSAPSTLSLNLERPFRLCPPHT